jgi:hypothetical protein
MLLSDYIAQVQFLLHDQANQDFSQPELIAAINNARTAVALDFQCCRQTYLTPPANIANQSFYSPVGLPAFQEAYQLNGLPGNSNGGVVVGATVAAGGANYSPATTVTFSAGPAGSIRATGVPVIGTVGAVAGVITAINMTAWGTGYLPAVPGTATFVNLPTVTIADTGGGSGASAIAVMFNQVFNVLSISNIWGNQRYMLKWRSFTLFQAYMRSQLFFTNRPVVWTIQEEMGLVLIQPPPDQAYQTEWDTIATPVPLTALTDNDTQIIAPANDAVQYYAAHYCLNKLQNFNQAEFMLKLYSARVPKIIIGKNGFRIPNPYHKTFQRRVMR